MSGRSWVVTSVVVVASRVCMGTTLSQISHDHAVYIDAQNGDVLSITTENRGSSDPAYVHVFGPNGRLQERLEITDWTTTYVTLSSGTGVYKILPVTNMYVYDYSIAGSRPIVVEPTDHVELIRVTGSADLYFQVPANTPSMTFHAHSMWSTAAVTEELYDPNGSLVHTFVLPPHTFQEDYVVADPMPGSWRCRFVTSAYDRCGAWLEGVPNYFAADPADWFEPGFYDSATSVTLSADANTVVSSSARLGINWWLNPWYPDPQVYEAERDAVAEALMDTARLGVKWSYREPDNDNSDPFDINWAGFNFSGHDPIVEAYYDDVVSAVPNAMPVLMMYWDNVGGNAVTWQLENPAVWTQAQREEYAEFVLATMIHTVAPDLQDPPDPAPAYDFTYVELLNEPNLVMGSSYYQAYIDLVITVGQRLQAHPDPRINSLKIVAPGVSPGWGDADQVMENWIGKLIDQADAYLGGVNWHQYEYLHIEECHRFAEDLQNVKGWLVTRGDAVADEEILMTEMNQHGGGPTWWQRQDTFFASRWWAGACLSALRGGVDFLHYYKLVDDPPGSYNWKGMLFNDGPYDPPVFPGGPPHGRKPVYAAAKFINERRRDQVVSSTCDHPEIAHAVTLSQDHGGVTVLVANLFDRVIDLDLSVALPPDMRNKGFSLQVYQLDENSGASPPVDLPGPPPSSDLSASLVLSPQTIYAVAFRRSAAIPALSQGGMVVMTLSLLAAGTIIMGRRWRRKASKMRHPWNTLLLVGTVWTAVIGSAAPVHAQIGFDDSDPNFVRIWNADYYEIAIRKSDGRALYIRDKTTGQDVSPGNVTGPWALRFSDGTLLDGVDFSPADPSRLFSYSWDPNTSTLTLDYSAAGEHAADVTLVLRPGDGPELDSELTLRNNSGHEVAELAYPYNLPFLRSEIQGVFVPYFEGMKLLQSFFDDDGWDFVSGYPGHFFADFAFSELSSGTLSLFVVRNLAEPFVPSFRQVTRGAEYAGGVAKYGQNYLLVVPAGAQWTSPTTVLSIGSTLQQAMSSYWVRNGHDGMPTLADKLDPQSLVALSRAVFIKWDFWWGALTFPQFQAYLSNLPAGSLLHFVAFWPRGFDENYPDYLPPNPTMGTLSEFQELVSYAQSTGHLVMPYTNPTWWDDESPTLAKLGPDIAVRNQDGTYRYETYGGTHGGYVVSPHDPRVVLRQDQTRTEYTVTVPCDFLFEDQVGGRGPTFDGHPDAPGPYQYNQGLVDLAARTATFLPPMSENGFDRLSWHETGYCGSHRVGWHPWPASTYVSYPMAQQWAHRNMIFYTHNLAQNTMTLDLPDLTYHVALGYSLSFDPVYRPFKPDLVWLKLVDKFQKHFVSSLVGVGLDSYEYLQGAGRTRTGFSDGVEIIANLNPAPFAYGDHVIASDGFLAEQASTVRAGVLSTLHGQALSGVDPHYLILEYSENTIAVFQPRGDDTLLTLPKPASWVGSTCIQLKAIAESGTEFDRPLNIQSGYLLFDYVAEVDGQAIDHFVVSDCLCGDADCDGDVDADDYNEFALCFTGPGGPPIDPACVAGDFDGDGDVDCDDWQQFLLAWTEPGDPPELPQCAATIPTVSEWGVIAMVLLVLVVGALIFSRRRTAPQYRRSSCVVPRSRRPKMG